MTHGTFDLDAATQTLLTDEDAEIASLVNYSVREIIYITPTVGDVLPLGLGFAVALSPGESRFGFRLADSFPGVPGATRLWAWTERGARLFVSSGQMVDGGGSTGPPGQGGNGPPGQNKPKKK